MNAMSQAPQTTKAERQDADEPEEVDPRPHWIPFVVIFVIVVPLLGLMVLGTILWG